jgi:DNA-binding Lrp family transcriptional regulator
MGEFIIETPIDKLLELLRKKNKIPLSEAARALNIKETQLDSWIDALEDQGIIELKYPVLGEPQIVLKGPIPEEMLKETKEKVEEIIVEKPKVEEPIEEIEEKIKPKKIIKQKEIRVEGKKEDLVVSEKLRDLENRVSEISQEVDSSKFKEELFEVLVVLSEMKDTKRIFNYLKVIEKIIQEMKARKLWNKVDQELITTVLTEIAENWREKGNESVAKIFEELIKRIRIS